MTVLESRCRGPEKLTETLGLKIGDTMLREVRAVAEANNTEAPDWIRSLIAEALEKERARYQTLKTIFDASDSETKRIMGQQGSP